MDKPKVRLPIQSRIFLVGYPRSGTTLLQSLLAAHPEIASFPESHFFATLIHPRRLYSSFGIANPKSKETLSTFLKEINSEHLQRKWPRASFLVSQKVQEFVEILDRLALQNGQSIWLEKTPRHLYAIDCIEKYIAEPKFIHIVRNGQDAIASLYDVTQKHPQAWSGARSIDKCLQRWIQDIKISLANRHKPNHFIVRYEHLIAETRNEIMDLCCFLDVEFSEALLHPNHPASNHLILDWEPWKESVRQGIQNNQAEKFKTLFSDKQQIYILNQISDIDMNSFNRAFNPERLKKATTIPD